ncbi:Deoxyribonuclease Tat-D [Drechslerella dactyloides]|uniref:Deoxyribonuclease Tat-D n=1 Tax=Drechslerella dactyloides TaxID=74499 RepID=A0AAD6IP92_DREDA|nr:Deoxyribonuclease Tat-D [Drechslerella dactyloides]KAJ6257191.1 Deoxyribonuclease Tat-D [Drechslerella dactyloides]
MASTSTSDPRPSEPELDKDSESRYEPRYIDVGINLTDMMYQGFYHGRKVHEVDLENVIQRADAVGCKKLMVTGSDYKCSIRAMELAESYPGIIFATVGVHPCSASEAIKTAGGVPNLRTALKSIEDLALEGKARGTVTAFGEIGLDYDRFYLSDQDSQLRVFEEQLRIAERVDLPLFLHSRAAEEDFNRLLFAANLPRKGLVHSFTGTLEEMHTLTAQGFDIGINGCSLKTEENIAVVREVPLERLQIETDGPWCEIRATHASAAYLKNMPAHLTESVPKDVKKERFQLGMRVKGRNEPCAIAGVAWVIAQVKGVSFEEVCERSWANSMNMFRYDEAAALQEAWAKENSPDVAVAAAAAGGDGA